MKPQRFIADSAYGSAGILAWLLDEKNIAPHAPVWDKSERADGTFSRSDFLFDSVSNTYTLSGRQKSAALPPAISPCRGPVSQRTTRGSTEPVDPTAPERALKARCRPGQPRHKQRS